MNTETHIMIKGGASDDPNGTKPDLATSLELTFKKYDVPETRLAEVINAYREKVTEFFAICSSEEHPDTTGGKKLCKALLSIIDRIGDKITVVFENKGNVLGSVELSV